MKNAQIKVGLFGGSFDPIHNGHLTLAIWTQKALSLDRIIFVPAATPPHKLHHAITSAEHRLHMVELAIQNLPQFEVSAIEIERQGISYTIDTVVYLRKKYRLTKKELYLIIGADNLSEFSTWKDPDRILRLCQVVALPRPHVPLTALPAAIQRQVILLAAPLIDISATEIRQRIKNREPISHFVPPAVEEYIYQQQLYQ
ncbi:MAG: nicotinate-nucleotide adenylyltransferase [candidate division KSB1 bacterium]|nr:nicotinate-nucleotide adenylyltransferase [candidate division KSB1 bacterium]MDZ7339792.1 nicotinate-nucleotide adenylyltransferase [candidate division KSB1 bacterium]